MEDKHECFVVLGPSRSGTSLCAGLIQRMGVWLGEDLKEGKKYKANKFYYEDNKLIDFVLHQKGDAEEIVNRLSREKWGMKLPQLVEAWHLFKDLIDQPKFIVCNRNITSNVASYYKWTSKELKPAQLKDRIFELEHEISEIADHYPRITVQFDSWFNDNCEKQLQTLGRFVGLPITDEVRSLIDKDLRRE